MLSTVLQVLWPGDHADLLTVGVRLPLGVGADAVLRFHLVGVLADVAALQAAFAVKGPAGSKPCWLCRNLRGNRLQPDPDGILVPLEATRSRLVLHNDVSWTRQLNFLRRSSERETAAVHAANEQATGVIFDENSPLFHPQVRHLLDLSKFLFDPMHLVLSNGVASSQLCGVVLSQAVTLSK